MFVKSLIINWFDFYHRCLSSFFSGHDTDSQDNDPNNYIDETIEFLVSVEEIILE